TTPTTQSVSEPIVAGQPTSEYPAVVAFSLDGAPFCTGAIVAPRAVLTAAHCVATPGRRRYTRGDVAVIVGSDAAHATARSPTVDALVHPDFDATSLANDVAIVVLRDPLDTTPVELLSQPLEA